MRLLVSNVGSTSLKLRFYDMSDEKVLCEARAERVGSSHALFRCEGPEGSGQFGDIPIASYEEGIRLFLEWMPRITEGSLDASHVEAVAFKTVLAKDCPGVCLIDEEVVEGMQAMLPVAPVHNGAYLEAAAAFHESMPDVPMVGVFETAFHETIPLERRMYGIPYEWYERYGIARLGFHGASHAYVAATAPALGPANRVVSCHLGGSSSICAIQDGKSVDTSFGFSLQTGLIHANRVGDADPYLVPFLLGQGMQLEEVLDGLERHGGLLGISGVSNDLRDVQEAADAGNERAELAIRVFAEGIIRYVGSFAVEMGGMDQLVFTGGIGEHAWRLREMVCGRLGCMGVELDTRANSSATDGKAYVISRPSSRVVVSVIPANEELGVARQAFALLQGPTALEV